MKTKLTLVALAVFFFFAEKSMAQTAGDYFNRAARSYVKTEKESALKEVNDGLGKYPNDAKLKALKEKLEKEQEEEQQQQQDQQQQQNQQQNQQNQSQSQTMRCGFSRQQTQ